MLNFPMDSHRILFIIRRHAWLCLLEIRHNYEFWETVQLQSFFQTQLNACPWTIRFLRKPLSMSVCNFWQNRLKFVQIKICTYFIKYNFGWNPTQFLVSNCERVDTRISRNRFELRGFVRCN